jgi:hypothetical protein
VSTNTPRQRAVIGWAVAFAALIVAFIVTVVILNASIYSARGFASSYLDALNRHDATTARELPGVAAADNTASNLLTDGTLGTISDIRFTSDTTDSHGIHTLTFHYRLGKTAGTTSFHVKQTGAFLGLFPRWSFSTSPLATVAVTVLHDPRFRVNGTDVTSTAKKDAAASYVVFAPGLYSFDHKSSYLVATPVGIPVEEPGTVTPVQVNVQANDAFVSSVSTELDRYFTACATQKVLLPTSCPFGKSFNNRVVSTPAWKIAKDPKISIVPDGSSGNWLVPTTTGQAHLTVKVQSLFDGTVSTYDRDVAFPVSYTIDIGAENHLTITEIQ